MALLGGSFFSVDVLPEVIQKFSFFSLNGVALKGFLKIILGCGFADVSNNILILAIMGILLTTLGVLIFNREESEYEKHSKITYVKA